PRFRAGHRSFFSQLKKLIRHFDESVCDFLQIVRGIEERHNNTVTAAAALFVNPTNLEAARLFEDVSARILVAESFVVCEHVDVAPSAFFGAFDDVIRDRHRMSAFIDAKAGQFRIVVVIDTFGMPGMDLARDGSLDLVDSQLVFHFHFLLFG
ncbi:hypothetical protein TW83_09860, partial [Paracoccus sp. S4493]